MSEQEQIDLDAMKAEIQKVKIQGFDNMVSYLRMPLEQLPATGHKTIAAAIQWTLELYKKQIDKLTNDFIKKYPDER